MGWFPNFAERKDSNPRAFQAGPFNSNLSIDCEIGIGQLLDKRKPLLNVHLLYLA